MVDREKVIQGLEHCGQPMECDGCPYDTDVGNCFANLKADALELLKKQEPVAPKEERRDDVDSIYRCGNCGVHFYYREQKYCAICGRAVKWDG